MLLPILGLSAGISCSGGLVKPGNGRFTLAAANTYSGTTQVQGGVLDSVSSSA